MTSPVVHKSRTDDVRAIHDDIISLSRERSETGCIVGAETGKLSGAIAGSAASLVEDGVGLGGDFLGNGEVVVVAGDAEVGLEDRAGDQAFDGRGLEEGADGAGAGGLAEDGYLGGVAAEGCDVVVLEIVSRAS